MAKQSMRQTAERRALESMAGIIVSLDYAYDIMDGRKKYEYRNMSLPERHIGVPIHIIAHGNSLGYCIFSESSKLKEPKTLYAGDSPRLLKYAWKIESVAAWHGGPKKVEKQGVAKGQFVESVKLMEMKEAEEY